MNQPSTKIGFQDIFLDEWMYELKYSLYLYDKLHLSLNPNSQSISHLYTQLPRTAARHPASRFNRL
jgi:hypothetical protein